MYHMSKMWPIDVRRNENQRWARCNWRRMRRCDLFKLALHMHMFHEVTIEKAKAILYKNTFYMLTATPFGASNVSTTHKIFSKYLARFLNKNVFNECGFNKALNCNILWYAIFWFWSEFFGRHWLFNRLTTGCYVSFVHAFLGACLFRVGSFIVFN